MDNEIKWIKSTPSLQKGVEIINNLDETKSEQFLKRITTRMKVKDTEIFTENEKQKLKSIFNLDESNLSLVVKSVVYIFKRTLKYVFKPMCLKSNLVLIGLNEKISDLFVKLWSQETRIFFDHCSGDLTSNLENEINISWALNAELSSEYQKKIKVPKAYLSISKQNGCQDLELTHSELYTMFLQFEAVQNELDFIT